MLTAIATGWTECAPLLVREQTLLVGVLREVQALMPFPLLGFDSDNDSVFINETVRDYCLAAGIVFTRCRPYRKNDQPHVEQKNGAIVRRIVGYRRFEGRAAARELAALYGRTRLCVPGVGPFAAFAFRATIDHTLSLRAGKRSGGIRKIETVSHLSCRRIVPCVASVWIALRATGVIKSDPTSGLSPLPPEGSVAGPLQFDKRDTFEDHLLALLRSISEI